MSGVRKGSSSRWPSASAEPWKQDRDAEHGKLEAAQHRESASHEVAFGEASRRLDTYAGMTPKSPAHATFRAVLRGATKLRKCFEDVLVRPFLAKDPGEQGSELLTQ